MRRKYRALLSLSWHDLWVLSQAWVVLLAVDLGLRALSFRRVQELVASGREDAGTPEGQGAWVTMHRLQRFVGIAGRNHLYPMPCLQRSLCLQWLMGRRGISADLRIGVRKEGDGLATHAWLEYQGQPVGEMQPIEARFAPLEARDVGC